MGQYWAGVITVGAAVGAGYVIRAHADGIPATNTMTYAGTLSNSSGPLSGSHTVTVSLYSAASGGTQQCTTGATPVTVLSNGYFSVPLPVACTPYVAANPNEWVDVVVDGTDTGTVQIGAVPYAVTASNAVTADNPSDAGTLGSSIATLQSQSTTLTSDISGIDTSLAARLAAMNVTESALATDAGSGGSINGSTDQLFLQAGTYVASATSGSLTVPFKTTFPHGLLTVVEVPGDSGDGACEVTTWTTYNFTVYCAAVDNGGVRINYIAVGW
jgi:hypothetical protein